MVDVGRSTAIDPATATGHQKREQDHQEEPGDEPEQYLGPRTPRQILDVAQVMGIPAEELTARVREAISIIVSEFDTTRAALEREQERVKHYRDLADRHARLPLMNRRALFGELSRLINRAKQTRTTSCLAIISIGGTEAARIELGRSLVDGIFAQAAGILAAEVRASDVVGSLGGGDFGVILTLAGRKDAEAKVLELTAKLADGLKPRRPNHPVVDIYWGVAPFGAEAEIDAILDAADENLRDNAQRQRSIEEK
jgi:diguanylate cyclase (GGDEF)-like protein